MKMQKVLNIVFVVVFCSAVFSCNKSISPEPQHDVIQKVFHGYEGTMLNIVEMENRDLLMVIKTKVDSVTMLLIQSTDEFGEERWAKLLPWPGREDKDYIHITKCPDGDFILSTVLSDNLIKITKNGEIIYNVKFNHGELSPSIFHIPRYSSIVFDADGSPYISYSESYAENYVFQIGDDGYAIQKWGAEDDATGSASGFKSNVWKLMKVDQNIAIIASSTVSFPDNTFQICILKYDLIQDEIMEVVPISNPMYSVDQDVNYATEPIISDNNFYFIGRDYSSYKDPMYDIFPSPSFRLYKTDINGKLIWEKNIDLHLNGIDIHQMAATPGGGVMLAGYVVLPSFAKQALMMRIDAQGNVIQKDFDLFSSSQSEYNTITAAHSGKFILGGSIENIGPGNEKYVRKAFFRTTNLNGKFQ